MKKIMFFISAVCLAAGMHAATVSWNITNVKDATGATALKGGSVYVFAVAGSTADTTWVADLAGDGAAAVQAAMAGAMLSYTMPDSVAAGNYSYSTANGFTLKTNSELGLSGSTQYTLYAVVFDTATITDSSNFFVTKTGSGATYGDTAVQNKVFGLSGAPSATASNWNKVSDVPEPTSGLLLVVGGAFLALRRRQK